MIIRKNFCPVQTPYQIDQLITDSNKLQKKKANSLASIDEYKLSTGDIIKLGRMIFCVKLINIQNLEDNLSVQSNCSKSSETVIQNKQENDTRILEKIMKTLSIIEKPQLRLPSEATCRICLQNDSSEVNDENQLISPCSCSGSVKYVHLACLKFWLKNQQKVKPKSYGI